MGPAGIHQGGRSEPTPDNLNTVGGKLKTLPQGWTFETMILEKDLVLDTTKAGGWAAIVRDELHCTYQGCGYGADSSANFRAESILSRG